MTYVLTLLGTDTTFSPGHVDNAYDKAETLSYVSTLIPGNPLPTDKVTEYKNDKVAVVDGPTTLGSEVGDRIARGVLSILEAISRGETDISIIAHSRGAVEAILVAHELERIQTLLATADLSNDSAVKAQLIDSACKYTKAAMNDPHGVAFNKLNLSEIAKHIGKVKVSMFNIDPVPGGNYMAITKASSLAWRDPRFYVLPKIVKEYEQYTYENERTRCFKPIVPKCASTETKFKLCSLPGHHGTGSGNLKSQQRTDVPKGTTEHVQELVLLKIVDFLTRNGVTVSAELNDSDPFANKVALLLKDPLTPERFEGLYFDLYKEILANKEAYTHFNTTAYATLGQEQALLKWLWKVVDQRIVHHQAHNDTFLETIVPPVPGDHFLNYEHARIHLNRELHLNKGLSLSETIQQASNRLVELCRHRKQLTDLKDLTASVMGDSLVPALETKQGFDLLLEGLGMLIEEVKRPYLQDQFTDPDVSAELYQVVSEAFDKFKDKNLAENEWAKTILDTLNKNVGTTLETKRAGIEEQYTVLSQKLEKNEFFVSLQSKMKDVSENLKKQKTEEDLPLEVFLVNFLEELESHSKLTPSQLRSFIENQLGMLNKMEITNNLSISTRQVANFIMNEAIDDSLGYDTENLMREVIKSYKQLDEFKAALPNFKQLYADLPYDYWALGLAQKRAHMIHLAAQYIAEKGLDLETVIRPLYNEHQELYRQIGGLAIGLGAKNQLVQHNEELGMFMSELQGEVSTLKQKNEELLSRLEKAVKEHEQQLVELNLSHENELSSLNQKNGVLQSDLEEANQNYLREVKDLTLRHETVMKDLTAEKDSLAKKLETADEKLLKETEDHQKAVKDLTQKHEDLRAELDKVSKEHETALHDLGEKYKRAMKDLEGRTDELETATKEYKEKVELLVQNHQQVVNDLTIKNDGLKNDLEKAIKTHEDVVKQLTQEHQLKVEELKADNKNLIAEMDKAIKGHDEAVKGLTQDHDLIVKDLKQINASLNGRLEEAAKSYETEVKKLRETYQLSFEDISKGNEFIRAEFKKATEVHEMTITRLTQDHQLEVNALTQKSEELNGRLDEANKAYEKAVQELKGTHQVAIDELTKRNEHLNSNLGKAFADFEKEVRTLNQQHQMVVAGLTRDQESLGNRLLNAQQALEQSETVVNEFIAHNEQLAEENRALQQEVERLQTERDHLEGTLTNEQEVNCQQIINTKLNPLTKNYLLHLVTEINKLIDPKVDVTNKNLFNVINEVNNLAPWTKDESSRNLKQKFEAVSGLYKTLQIEPGVQMKPSAKIVKFYNELSVADEVIKQHRDPMWLRLTANLAKTLAILLTGVAPGLVYLGLKSHFEGTPMKFWESSGQTFFQKSKDEIGAIKEMEDVISPPEVPPVR